MSAYKPAQLTINSAEIRFAPGTHQLYQLLLGYRPADEGWEDEVVGEVDGQVVYDALVDPALARDVSSSREALWDILVDPNKFKNL